MPIVAEGAGRPAEAERWYWRPIELGEELKLIGELGKWYNNLAGLLLAQDRLDEAETHAQRAAELEEGLALLTEGIDRNSALVVRRILQALEAGPAAIDAGGESGAVQLQPAPPPAAAGGGWPPQGISLGELLGLFERVVQGERELGGQLFMFFQ